MKGFLRSVGFLIAGLLLGELVQRLLRSGAGKAVTGKIGHPELSTCDGAELAKKDARRTVGLVHGLIQRAEQAPGIPEPRPALPTLPRWVTLARDAAEMLLAAGGVLKAAADFVQSDEQLRRRIARFAGR
ncbi:MAG TPA: hypothetical protein VFZ25_09585 [Chloroflexota bacterium]|nr:hypothetical protein [Chloroflexota bacterium]